LISTPLPLIVINKAVYGKWGKICGDENVNFFLIFFKMFFLQKKFNRNLVRFLLERESRGQRSENYLGYIICK